MIYMDIFLFERYYHCMPFRLFLIFAKNSYFIKKKKSEGRVKGRDGQKENVINNHAQCACILERHDDKVVTVITDLGKSTRIDTVALPTTREYNYKVINLYNTAVCPRNRPSEIEERNAISVS